MSDPIFKSIFGTSWDSLPPIMKTHYAITSASDDKVTVEGDLDVLCKGHIALLKPIFWLMGSVPLLNEQSVPVTVHFSNDGANHNFYFDRVFYFKGRKPYHFKSFMMQVSGNEVIEVMKFGFCWRMNYLWEDGKVKLRHKGYALKLANIIMPLPITWLIGRGDADEWAIDENSFEMCATITHPLWGKVYEYKGRFEAAR